MGPHTDKLKDELHHVAPAVKKEIKRSVKDFARFYVVEIIIILCLGTSPAIVIATIFHLSH